MTMRDEIQRLICDTDLCNGGSVSYGPDQITPEFARERLSAGVWADGTEITSEQAELLRTVAEESRP